MDGKVFLSGGGNEKKTFELDEIFLQNVSKILYVPLAWKNNDFDSCLNWFKGAMFSHKQVKIDMLIDLDKRVDLKEYDAVYIGGGNTFKLLKKIKDSRFDKKLIDYYHSGGTVYGGSAGAIIWGKDINIALICRDADVNEVQLKDTSGFDLLHGTDIQCHYEVSQLKEHQRYIAKSGRNVIAIPEESALLIKGDKLTVIGTKPITLITKLSVEEFDVNQEVRLTDSKPTKMKR